MSKIYFFTLLQISHQLFNVEAPQVVPPTTDAEAKEWLSGLKAAFFFYRIEIKRNVFVNHIAY